MGEALNGGLVGVAGDVVLLAMREVMSTSQSIENPYDDAARPALSGGGDRGSPRAGSAGHANGSGLSTSASRPIARVVPLDTARCAPGPRGDRDRAQRHRQRRQRQQGPEDQDEHDERAGCGDQQLDDHAHAAPLGGRKRRRTRRGRAGRRTRRRRSSLKPATRAPGGAACMRRSTCRRSSPPLPYLWTIST